jgi:hypothetical protein
MALSMATDVLILHLYFTINFLVLAESERLEIEFFPGLVFSIIREIPKSFL